MLAVLLVSAGGIQIYVSFFLDNRFKTILIDRFHAASEHQYHLQMGDFDLKVFGRALEISNIEITKKDKKADNNLKLNVKQLNISGINLIQFFLSNKLSLNEIDIVRPQIQLTTSGTDSTGINSTDRIPDYWSGITSRTRQTVSISHLNIQDFSFQYNRAEIPAAPYLSFQNGFIQMQNITIDSTFLANDRILPARQFSAFFEDLRFQSENKFYRFSAEKLDFSSAEMNFNIHALRVSPQFDKKQFAARKGHETDRITMAINEIQAEGIDYPKLAKNEGLFVRQIMINQPNMNIYRDKRPPFPANNNPPLPQQMIRRVPFPFNIDSITISKGNIKYSERKAEANEAGFISFDDFSASFSNLTNIKNRWNNQKHPFLKAETHIMGKAKLRAEFTFPMRTGEQHIKGNLESMDMKPLNKALEPLAFVRIDDGKILGMHFSMNLTAQLARGNMTFRYEDLKISLLNKDFGKETLGHKFTSLLANTFKVKSNNSGDNIRIVNIDFQRDDQKSVFNYWWKSLLSGLKASIGV